MKTPSMNSTPWLRATLALTALACLSFGHSASAQQSCPSGTSPLQWTSNLNTSWDMCWSIDPLSGLVLERIFFDSGSTRRKVLDDASIAQLYVAFDDGDTSKDFVTEKGLGTNLRTLTTDDCFGTSATFGTDGGVNVMCNREVSRGHLYRFGTSSQEQGSMFEVFSVVDIKQHTWIIDWRFYEDGTFEARLGSTGRLPSVVSSSSYGEPVAGGVARSWSYNVFWRLDVDIDGAANDTVREFNILQSGTYREKHSREITDIQTEVSRKLKAHTKRSWQILDTASVNADGHPRSYHLMPMHAGIRYQSSAHDWSRYDLYVTKYNACERYVINNPTTGCAGDLASGFVNGESVGAGNVVLWYRISRHHFPRDEDVPFRSLHWDSIQMVPRDWDDLSPVTFRTPTHDRDDVPAYAALSALTGLKG